MDLVSFYFERDLHDVIYLSPSTWLSFNSLCPSSLSSLSLFTSLLFSAFLSLVFPSSNFTSFFSFSSKILAQRQLFRLCYSSVSYLLLSQHLTEWWGSLLPSLPFPPFPVFSALLPPHFLPLSLFPFVSICGVKWGGDSQLSCACWLACAMCQAGRIMTRTQTFMLIYIQHPTPHRPTSLAPKKRGITSGDAKNKVHAKRKRTRLGGREVVKCWGDENNR